MQALADSAAFWILLIAVLIVAYMLPTLIGLIRGVDALALVFLVSLIGAPIMIGWPAALILAFGPRRLPPEPARPPYLGAMNWSADSWMPGPYDIR
jgi:hypothetical protein